MSAQDQIGRLEALLRRVTSRAAEPRAVVARMAPSAAAAASPAHHEEAEPLDLPTRPPPPGVAAPAEIDVELPEPAIELRSSVAEQRPLQSDERIVAAKPIELPVEEDVVVPLVRPAAEEAPQLEVAAEFMSASDLEEEAEPEEAAPLSSRRPLGPPPAEVLDQKAFGKEETPEPAIHTPPPESGKLPAAPELSPIVEMADYDNQDITGVHHTPAGERRSTASTEDALAQSGEHAASEPTVEAAKLAPEVTKPTIVAAAGIAVADVIGTANAFKPATFGELLDATLKL